MHIKVFLVSIIGIACFLKNTHASLASNRSHEKVQRTHSEIMSYFVEKVRHSEISMRSSGTFNLNCYNGFIPLIYYLSNNAKEVSNYCVSDAETDKNHEMSNLLDERRKIELEVNKITKSFADCAQKKALQYFECHAGYVELNKKIIQIVKENSIVLIPNYERIFAEIDETESICLMNAIEMAKVASDKKFDDLKSCIKGGPAIQPPEDDI